MSLLSHLRNPIRLTAVGLLITVTILVYTGTLSIPAGTGIGVVLLLGVVLTDLLREYSPDTSDPGDEPQPPGGPELDLDTDSLIIDTGREDR